MPLLLRRSISEPTRTILLHQALLIFQFYIPPMQTLMGYCLPRGYRSLPLFLKLISQTVLQSCGIPPQTEVVTSFCHTSASLI